MPLEIKVFRCLSDNIGILLYDDKAGYCIAIDAPDASAIKTQLAMAGQRLTHILVTHSHLDHVQGISALKDAYSCRVIAPLKALDVVPCADEMVSEGSRIKVANLEFEVWETPGHCADHVSYIAPSHNLAFVGDVLFTLGCGRIFGGDFQGMWHSLSRLMTLPNDTQIFCGHDYTLSNGRFALAVDPHNMALRTRVAEAEAMAAEGRFMIPSHLAEEKATNPFLRVGERVLAEAVGQPSASPFEVFKALRELKNNF